MRIINHFIFGELHPQFRKWLILCLLAGISLSGILVIMNLSIQHASDNQINPYYAIFFFTSLGLFIWSYKKYYNSSALLFNEMVSLIRTRITNNIFKLSFREVERLNPEKIQIQLITISAKIIHMSDFVSRVLMYFAVCIFILCYFLSISVWVFLLMATNFIIAVFYFYRVGKQKLKLQEATLAKQSDFLDIAQYLVKGFRDIKFNQLKAKRSFKVYRQKAHDFQEINAHTSRQALLLKGKSEIILFTLIACCVYILPNISLAKADVIMVVTAVLFISPIVFMISVYSRFVEDFLHHFNELGSLYYAVEEKVQNAGHQVMPTQHKPLLKKQIVLKDLSFRYEVSSNYYFGPVNFTIKQGELIFIIGGNGSGKSTLLKLLTGLYPPSTGKIIWDNKSVSAQNVNTYRALFSVIFTDFHLFEKIYGIEKINEGHVNYLLNLMELSKVTYLQADKFSSLSLSTGQKKRLALLHSFLDNKAVYVLDEVAADQDPYYRKFFYQTVLPELKKAGKTILVVSHDDHYFHVADRILEVRDGKVYPYKKKDQTN